MDAQSGRRLQGRRDGRIQTIGIDREPAGVDERPAVRGQGGVGVIDVDQVRGGLVGDDRAAVKIELDEVVRGARSRAVRDAAQGRADSTARQEVERVGHVIPRGVISTIEGNRRTRRRDENSAAANIHDGGGPGIVDSHGEVGTGVVDPAREVQKRGAGAVADRGPSADVDRAARLSEDTRAAGAWGGKRKPIHAHRAPADLIITEGRIGVTQSEDTVRVRRGQHHGPAGLVTRARRRRGIGTKVHVDGGDRSAGADQQHAARVGSGTRRELSGGHGGRSGSHRKPAPVHREVTRIGVRAAEGQHAVAGLGQGERERTAVLQRTAEGRAAVVTADGERPGIGRAAVLHRAGAGQGADGSVEVIQAQGTGGLDDMGGGVAEALGDAGLQDAVDDGGRAGIGATRAREGQDARAILFQTERAGDGAAHGEGGAVGSAADDVPALIRPERDGRADGDGARVRGHVDAIGRRRGCEGQGARRDHARGDANRSDSAGIGSELQVLEAEVAVKRGGDRRTSGAVGAEDDPIVHAGQTVGVGAGQVGGEITREPAVPRPVPVAQGVGPIKVGREGRDAESDEGVGGGQRPGTAGHAETAEGISGAAGGQAAGGGEQIIITDTGATESGQVQQDLTADHGGGGRADTVIGGERAEFEAEHGATRAGSAQRQDARAKIDGLAGGVD